VFHCNGNKELFPAMTAFQTCVLQNVELNLALGTTVIIDRHWPSEYVYARLFRKEMLPNVHNNVFKEWCRKLRAEYIYCDSDSSLARYIQNSDPAHPYDPDQHKQIRMGYIDWFLNEIAGKEEYHRYDLAIDGQPSALDNFISGLL
jgi:thymidylate kinase